MVDWDEHWKKLRDDIDGGRKTEISASDFKPKPGISLRLFIRALRVLALFGILSGLARRMSDDNDTVASEIPAYKFNYCRKNLKRVKIPEGVREIQDYAFANCWDLMEVTIPDGVKTIGISAFNGCSSLMCVTIPGSVTEISHAAFLGCTKLTSVKILQGVTMIHGNAFHMCKALTNVTIPDSVQTIGFCAFEHCNLKTVMIPKSVKTIGSQAFNGCENLTTVTIPDGVTTIGKQAFSGCKNLNYIITNNKSLDKEKKTLGIRDTCEIITPSELLEKTEVIKTLSKFNGIKLTDAELRQHLQGVSEDDLEKISLVLENMKPTVPSVVTGRSKSARSNELAKALGSSASFSYTSVFNYLASLLELDKKPSNTPVGRLTGPQ